MHYTNVTMNENVLFCKTLRDLSDFDKRVVCHQHSPDAPVLLKLSRHRVVPTVLLSAVAVVVVTAMVSVVMGLALLMVMFSRVV